MQEESFVPFFFGTLCDYSTRGLIVPAGTADPACFFAVKEDSEMKAFREEWHSALDAIGELLTPAQRTNIEKEADRVMRDLDEALDEMLRSMESSPYLVQETLKSLTREEAWTV